eukprot:SAG31_NODE_15043_length_773_cov_1.410979_2_plen_106_part_00
MQVDYWATGVAGDARRHAQAARVVKDWAPWYRGPYVLGTTTPTPAAQAPAAGHYRSFLSNKNDPNSSIFHFVMISGAGHEVPSYRPHAALWMVKQFLLIKDTGSL